jgi:hypothetical protein
MVRSRPILGSTYRLLETIQSVNTGTGFKESLCLSQAKATGSTRNANDLPSQAEFGESVLGANSRSLLLDRHDRSRGGFDGDRHDC